MESLDDFMEKLRKKERILDIFGYFLVFLFVLSIITSGCDGSLSYELDPTENRTEIKADETIGKVLKGYRTYEYGFEEINIANYGIARSELVRLYNDLEYFKSKSSTFNYQAKFIHLQALLLHAMIND